ncbi:MAG: transcriptional repressor [Clostridiales bacterium]|nr:transcriptional repressor [Clostridiales bacterium]
MKKRRYSKKRQAILERVCSTDVHPSAEWVYQELKPEFPDLSLGTVYRNLAAFKQEGVIESLGVIDGLERFDGNTEPHAHFICKHCAAVIDLPGLKLPNRFEDVIECGRAEELELRFIGTCNKCASTRKEKN